MDASFIETKWLPLTLGIVIITLGLMLIPLAVSQPICLLGFLLLFDGEMAFRVITFATINDRSGGRRERLERDFYKFSVAKKRYIFALILFFVALGCIMIAPIGDWYLAVIVTEIVAYAIPAMRQIFQLRRQGMGR